MVGVVVRKQNMCNPMPVDTGLNEVHERARAEIQHNKLVGVNEIAGGGPSGMDVRPGSKDCKAHRLGLSLRSAGDGCAGVISALPVLL